MQFQKISISTEAYRCHPTSDFNNPTSDLLKSDIRHKIRHPTLVGQVSGERRKDGGKHR